MHSDIWTLELEKYKLTVGRKWRMGFGCPFSPFLQPMRGMAAVHCSGAHDLGLPFLKPAQTSAVVLIIWSESKLGDFWSSVSHPKLEASPNRDGALFPLPCTGKSFSPHPSPTLDLAQTPYTQMALTSVRISSSPKPASLFLS